MDKKPLPLISMHNVSIRLWDRTVFDKISWSIYSDQFWAVCGKTGSGKTVLARALCGEFPFVSGEIIYNFKESTNPFLAVEPQARIGYVGFDINRQMKSDQNRFVQSRYWSNDESLSVRDYLSRERVCEINPFQIIKSQPGEASSYRKRQKELLRMFQIENLLDREIDMLSNGECRKVAMVYQLLRDPVLLILDNPFQGLDFRYRDQLCGSIIPSLISQGITCMIITSDKTEIPRNVTHLLEIDSFKITSSGPFKHALSKGKTKSHPGLSMKRGTAEPIAALFCERPRGHDVLVRMSHVNVKSGRKFILKDVCWTIRKGEHWAVTGPNGSGKTTLLSLILGDHPQMYANDIEVFGVRWGQGSNIWSIKKRIGWMAPELQVCYPLETSAQDVVLSGYYDSIGLFCKPSKHRRCKVEELFEIFGISELKEVPFGSMSEGNQRLLLLLRAIIKGPELLILDEPCQGLPPDSRQKVISTIDTLAYQCSTAIVFVTHQPDELPSCINSKFTLG
jgi:molybdate transport system ATP-binding protein